MQPAAHRRTDQTGSGQNARHPGVPDRFRVVLGQAQPVDQGAHAQQYHAIPVGALRSARLLQGHYCRHHRWVVGHVQCSTSLNHIAQHRHVDELCLYVRALVRQNPPDSLCPGPNRCQLVCTPSPGDTLSQVVDCFLRGVVSSSVCTSQSLTYFRQLSQS
uniref:(northern house mosquito) hypothetical protein n=1 Tax=Culex pipiens TaxID=7175 RepID=A0A8D8DFH1_CULPI